MHVGLVMSVCFMWFVTGEILVKFGMNVILLEATPYSLSAVSNNTMVDTRI